MFTSNRKSCVRERQYCAPNATIPLIALSLKSAIIPELRWLSRNAGGSLCLFCRKFFEFLADFWAELRGPPNRRHAAAIRPPQMWIARLMRPSSSACQNSELSPCWLYAWPSRSFRSCPCFRCSSPSESSLKKAASADPGRAAGKRGLDRPGQADRGGGPRGGTAGRHRGPDPGGHAGDRDFQPALYRERRPLHDRHPDVRVRHRECRGPRR